MRLKTSFDVHNKQYNSERPCFLLEVWLKFEICEHPTTESTLLEEEALFEFFPAVSVNENKQPNQLQTGLMRYMILKLHENETCSPCVCMVTGHSSVRLQAFSLLLKSL